MQPVLAIETNGYSYHNDETEQHQRDMMKDHILSNYGLPLLRLSTKGSGEREKMVHPINIGDYQLRPAWKAVHIGLPM